MIMRFRHEITQGVAILTHLIIETLCALLAMNALRQSWWLESCELFDVLTGHLDGYGFS